MTLHRVPLLLCVAAWGFVVTSATAAEPRFDEARALAREGRCAQAIPKFSAYLKDEPSSVGAWLGFADCEEKIGKLASALSAFRRAEELARKKSADGPAEQRNLEAARAQEAEQRIASLESRVSTVAIRAKPGVNVRLDEASIDDVALSQPQRADGGTHALRATAPGMTPWLTTFELAVEGQHLVIDVPALERENTPPVLDTRPSPAAHGNTQRTIAYILGGVGVVGLGVGTVFGLMTLSAKGEVDRGVRDCASPCAESTKASVRDTYDKATTSATVSTIGFLAGGAAATGAIVLYLTAPSSSVETTGTVRVSPWAGRDGMGALVGGAF